MLKNLLISLIAVSDLVALPKYHYKHGQKVGPLRPLRCVAQDDRELDDLRDLAVLETVIRHREIRSRKMRQSAGAIRKKSRGV